MTTTEKVIVRAIFNLLGFFFVIIFAKIADPSFDNNTVVFIAMCVGFLNRG